MSPLSGGRWKYTVSAKQQERRVNMQFNVFYKYHVSSEGNATTVSLHPLWRGAVCNVVTISSGRSGGGVAEVRSWTSEINESRRRPSIWSEATAAASQKHSRLHGSHVQEHKLVLAEIWDVQRWFDAADRYQSPLFKCSSVCVYSL